MSVLSTTTSQSMSSIEIAQLTDKRNADVMRDIRDQLYTGLYNYQFDNADLRYPSIQGLTVVIDEQTKRTKEILLDRYHTDILVSGYEVKYRAAIVKRWHELEAATAPKTYIEALRAHLQAEEEKERLALEVAKLNTVIDNEFGYCSILRAAIFLKVSETEFSWRALKSVSLQMGMEVKKAPSARFGYQNLYPIKAFERCYPQYDFDGLTPEKLDDKMALAITR